MHSADTDEEKPDIVYTRKLVESVPALHPIYKTHLDENDELLPHVFFGDLTRFVVAEVRRGTHTSWIERLLEGLEVGLEGSQEVQELISVSFVENLCDEDEAMKALKPLMRAKLKARLRAICGA